MQPVVSWWRNEPSRWSAARSAMKYTNPLFWGSFVSDRHPAKTRDHATVDLLKQVVVRVVLLGAQNDTKVRVTSFGKLAGPPLEPLVGDDDLLGPNEIRFRTAELKKTATSAQVICDRVCVDLAVGL
jgi:hypothetical protein